MSSRKRPSILIPSRGLLALAAMACAPALLTGPADAASSSAGEEFLSNAEAAPPVVIFIVDMSDAMDADCGAYDDSGIQASSGKTCYEEAIEAISQMTQHFDWAYYGVVGTSSTDAYFPIAPIGASSTDISTALSALTISSDGSGTTRNLAEAVAGMWEYVSREDSSDSCDTFASSSEVSGEDFCGVPLDYSCQEIHFITIAKDTPLDDQSPTVSSTSASMGTDIACNKSQALTTGKDWECLYDNAGHYAYDNDARSDLSDTQNVTTHTVGVQIDGSSAGERVFGNLAEEINDDGGEGIYTNANEGDEILGAIMTVMSYIRSGYYSRSTPVISAQGDHIIYSFYEIAGDNPLAEGHLRAYALDTDPASLTYGQPTLAGSSQFGGAEWDAGDLLVSRPVITTESNPGDMDGVGQRDIYTFIPELMNYSGEAVALEGDAERRMGWDYELVDAVRNNPAALTYFMDDSDSDGDGCGDDDSYDLNDDCAVDADDFQELVDFTRGLPTSRYRYLDMARGYWKLGDSPHSVPVSVAARNGEFTIDPTYREYLQGLVGDDIPEVVYIAANDGMVHAFRMYDDPDTTTSGGGLGTSEDGDEAGEELWAWIPAQVTYRDTNRGESWSGGLMDMMWYGRTFLFDGSPVVEDVWIDGYETTADGLKDTLGREWRRVLVVSQGKGGPVTLALDVTDPQDPQFLWEQANRGDATAMGYTVSTPVIANLYNAESSDSEDWGDTWVAMWGGGRAVPNDTDSNYHATSEANIYMWHIADDYWGTRDVEYHDDDGDLDMDWGSNGHPESGTLGSSLDMDSDGFYEYGYISGSLAAVDVDSDGDADVIYFPVTTSYEPQDMGGNLTELQDPGYTWMYKAIIDTEDPDDPAWCEFYDPYDTIGDRPEVYYAATTAWHSDGALGVYWGTGTPYDRDDSGEGYFFGVKDASPRTCGTYSELSNCEDGGVWTLDAGEGLTASPVVYAGAVYFSTYVPGADGCSAGEGRIYAYDYEDCTSLMDADGDGVVEDYLEIDGYPSGVAIGEHGQLYYGDSSGETINSLDLVTDPFLNTRTMGLREVF